MSLNQEARMIAATAPILSNEAPAYVKRMSLAELVNEHRAHERQWQRLAPFNVAADGNPFARYVDAATNAAIYVKREIEARFPEYAAKRWPSKEQGQ